jgi:biotin carboxyl carrier protein
MATTNWKLDGEKVVPNHRANVTWEDERFFKIEHKDAIFHGEIMEENLENRTLRVKINHREFILQKEGPLDALIAELGLDKVKVRKLHQLKSPMPGRIVSVAVEVGQEIGVGQELLTLEAMKMENVLKSEGVGVVKSIQAVANDVVDKGAVLIVFE